MLGSLQDKGIDSKVGWLCPESTLTAKIEANAKDVKEYIFKAITISAKCRDKFILAPIYQEYKLSSGGSSRKKPLWKIVKCAQQVGGLECGLYVMKYMYEDGDLEKVYHSPREGLFTEEELNEIRDKWEKYFTSTCMEKWLR